MTTDTTGTAARDGDARRGGPADSPFVRACRREPGPHTPVWFMRQAGRSLPEYREIRANVPMLESCRRPELVTEITLQPVRRHGVDAAILFSDIVVPVAAAGVDLDIVAGTGPVVAEPVRTAEDVERIRPISRDDVSYVDEAVRQLVAELGATPLIGFAGAPFTLASYLVEGGPSRTHAKTKALMYGDPDLWHALCGRLAEVTLAFLRVQIDAGVSAVQLFDSWAGALSEADYRRYVLPHSAHVLAGLADDRSGSPRGDSRAEPERSPGVPRIHFGVGTAELLGAMGEAGADVVGVDWRTPLDVATRRIGPDKAVQGNLDPCVLLAPWPVVEAEVRRILDQGRAAPGHVFNLGHGVLPETDPDVLTRVVALVHELSARPADPRS
ncbi:MULTISPECIES: uroporphyrinogen decarboxylase [Micromonospora]|uniref:Uroporphyrinogen decarboxylase n=1 Tax=Micromonospora solifontis TaxID=2487138 RepID=A0ABX9WPV3_9ACTN|nr:MULTISPECIES: uroporphyrinogen decarboxylase [Micromonospora]NES12927.1 uroporphyrinogen decarboxylase [Micromonospora sp. PPF5-17B]NES34755.1 uroporphyrinogen decarboxylase [Micromonospora solifontis]NES54852.1 uroporphyrinogen decarboxylase [Micromonospora sp. PPF5-6]RNM01658.1 uroporphyrinogen decarboxylase [Micromonospora solifontis]